MTELSIIVPTYNAERYIDEALVSIPDLTGLEVIVVDGKSEDGTLDRIRDSSREVDRLLVERDGGQSEAINKGFREASGNYVTWLNADDRFCEGAIEKALEEMDRQEHPWIAGNIIWIDKEGKIIKKRMGETFSPFFANAGFLHMYGPSSFIRRDLLREVGYLDTSLRYKMDTEFWYRLANAGYRYHRLSSYVWEYRVHEKSKTGPSRLEGRENEAQLREQEVIDRKYGLRRPFHLRILYHFYRFIHWRYFKSILESRFL